MKNILLGFIVVTISTFFVFFGSKLFNINRFQQLQNQKIIENNNIQLESTKNSERNGCLNAGETLDFIFNKDKRSLAVYIDTKEKRSYAFTVEDVSGGYGIEHQRCGFYVTRDFGFDYATRKELNNFSAGIWQYQVNGEGHKFITLAEQTPSGVIHHYMYDYLVDENGSYIVLEYPNKSPFFIVIKDIFTGKDLFSLTKDELATKYHIDIYNPELLMIRSWWRWYKDYLYFAVYPNEDLFRVNMSDKTLEQNPKLPDYSSDVQS